MDRDEHYTPNPFGNVQERPWEGSRPAPWARPDSENDPTVRFFWILLAAHVILWTVLPAVTEPNLPPKTVELLALGSQPQWGYFNHAPLPAWIAYGACALFGKAAWPAYLIAQLCTATCLWAAWRIGREFLHPWTAVCAAFALEGCLQFTFFSSELSAHQFARCWWALSILTFYWALLGNRRRHWLATAIFLALGILSTYDTALLLGAMILFTVWNDRARQCWDSSRPILSMMFMGLLLLPHTMWLFRNDFITLSATLASTSGTKEGHLVNPLWFGLTQLGAFIPVVILLAPLIRSVEMDDSQEVEPDHEFLRRYLVWVTALPFAVVLTGSLIAGIDLKEMWSGGLWTYAGVALLLWSRLDEQRWGWRRSILFAGSLAGAFAAGLVVHHTMLPGLSSQPADIHFPGQALAQTVQSTWKRMYPNRKLTAIGGPAWMAGNVSWYGSDSPRIYANLNPVESPWMSDDKLAQEGGVIVWDADQPANWVEQIQARFPYPAHEILREPALLPHQTRATMSPVKVAMAVILPRGQAPAVRQASLVSELPPEVPATIPASSLVPQTPTSPPTSIPTGLGQLNFEQPTPYRGAPTNPLEPNAVTGAQGIQQQPGTTLPVSTGAGVSTSPPAVKTPPPGGFTGSTIPSGARPAQQPPASQGTVPTPPANRSTIPGATIPGSTQPPAGQSTIPGRPSSSINLPVPSGQPGTGLAAPFPTGSTPGTGVTPASGQIPGYRAFPTNSREQ